MQSRSLRQDGHAEMRRALIRNRRADGGPGRKAGFTISAMAFAGILLVLSCGDGAVEPAPAEPPRPASITVEPSSATLTWLSETVVFRATVKDQYGAAFPGTVTWSGSDGAVFTIDAGGTASAVANGSGTVTATFQSLSATATVQVEQAPTALETASGSSQTADLGAVLAEPVVVRVADAGGSPVGGATVVFTPGVGHGMVDPTEAVTDSAGLARTVWTLGESIGDQTLQVAVGDAALAVVAHTINPDRAALVALYEATDGPNWVDNTNWLTDAPLGEWYGVDTDATGRVIRLDLSGHWEGSEQFGQGLQGSIPPELGNLANLEVLYLGLNGLTGTIPPELGNLANLKELGLGGNRLIGVIPPELGRLANLEVLWLARNGLTGTIPPELGHLTNLRRLGLRYNELTGPIPPEFRGLTKLNYLNLYQNQLTGPIPPWLGNLTELTELHLRYNDFTGPIPPELGSLDQLWLLFLEGNNLSGPIPPELGNLERLRLLWLKENNLSGPIPPELGNLANLTSLFLSENNLTGPIPPEFGNLERLETISLSGNLLTGSLPLNFARLPDLAFVECRRTAGVCLPATDQFREWIRQVEARSLGGNIDIPWCDEIDKEALRALYNAAGGSRWTRSNGWLEDENLDQWHGVRTDSTKRVSGLDLRGNGLSGQVPGALEGLVNLRELRIGDNALSGRLPLSLASLPLQEFDYADTSLCVADDDGFREWLNGIPRHKGTGVPCPPLTEWEVLQSLYRNTDGQRWHQRAGWRRGGGALEDWHGVETDAAGRVIGLRLGGNGLSGSIPVELGELSQLRILDLGDNDLSGSIPAALGDLGHLESLILRANQLRGDIPPKLGRLSQLSVLDLGLNRLSGSVPPELGSLDRLERLDLGGNGLAGEIPRELGKLANLTELDLGNNFLSGSVPPELGGLSDLEWLDFNGNQLGGNIPSELAKLTAIEFIGLADNQLTGPIPAELGGLADLRELRFSGNDLSGSIPPELGTLAELNVLEFTNNKLSGSIPPELGDLTSLVSLNLGDNELSGPLPTALGRAVRLEDLDLRDNGLSGMVPPEFANLNLLKSLILADNPGLAGPLPMDITALAQLELLTAGGTGLCRPADARFDTWFGAIGGYLARCREGPDVYLTQTVQSWGDPVPLLAGEPALLRVFVTAPRDATVTMPEVKATFYVNGSERHAVRVAADARTIPHEVTEGNLELSANAEIPDWVIVPGLEMVIEVDPERTLDPALGVTKRIPDAGRLAVDVQRMPPFRLTLIPILSETDPDSSVVQSVAEMAADPHGHELLRDVRTLLPVTEIAVATRQPVTVSTGYAFDIETQVRAMRLMEGGSGHWMGIGNARGWVGGVAIRGGWTSFSKPVADIIAHELGHNLSLEHAPCGSPDDTDPWFPHSGGNIGAWGYDFERRALVSPRTADVMSYCALPNWISDYFFNKALNHRLSDDDAAAAALAAGADLVHTLLLWGGRDQDGVPYLDPAFVVDAVPALPVAGTEYTIEGADADGTPLFSHRFDMPGTADVEGEKAGFVFALPVQPDWADDLASITLSGPGGSAILDETTDQPMAILRDPQTGQVRAFLRDVPPATQTAADAIGRTAGQGLETLFSRGIPGAEAWRR